MVLQIQRAVGTREDYHTKPEAALLHSDLPDCILRSEQFTQTFLRAPLRLSLPPPPHPIVSDLVKCSRTAAWCVLVQLINNSDNMIYAAHSAHKINTVIASQMYFMHLFPHLKSGKQQQQQERPGNSLLSSELHTSVAMLDWNIRAWSWNWDCSFTLLHELTNRATARGAGCS